MPVVELVEGLIPSGALFNRKMFHRPSQSIQLKGLVIRDMLVVQVLENVWLRAPHINTNLVFIQSGLSRSRSFPTLDFGIRTDPEWYGYYGLAELIFC